MGGTGIFIPCYRPLFIQYFFMTQSDRIRVALFFGGQSVEHEVSIQSAKNVFAALDKKKYQPILIYIAKTGRFFVCREGELKGVRSVIDGITIFQDEKKEISFVMGGRGRCVYINDFKKEFHIDVAFPVLHGPFGEDGSIQGLFRMAGTPFVGPGIIGSAVGMDKDVTKRLLRESGFPIADYIVARRCKRDGLNFSEIKKKLSLPFFVKPANAGSSVGVSKVLNEEGFSRAVETAFGYDEKILIEEAIVGREIECAVLGNENPKASILGEVIPTHDFYSYEAKYVDGDGAKIDIPADLPDIVSEKIRKIAIDVFKCLECSGMTRVDFFVTRENNIYVNEVNTIPGFTSISMYPKLWERSGVGYSDLLDKIIGFGLQKHCQ